MQGSVVKIMTIVGARPQFVKAAVVSRAFIEHGDRGFIEILLHTGQHFDRQMSESFFEELEIPRATQNLGVNAGTHGQNTGRMIEGIEKVIQEEDPDWVVVYGDTDSTLAGALAAAKLHVPVAHVEAGLRSFNRRMPEEINRILTDHASDLLLSPTDTATRNLINEGLSSAKVHQVGDVMYDAILRYANRAEQCSRILDLEKLESKNYLLATVHRVENTDDYSRLASILKGFGKTCETVVWPVHPRTLKQLRYFQLQVPRNVRIVDPVGYLDMTMLERHAAVIMTDSGGVQKEAYFFGVPCVTLRDETEWSELVEIGANTIAGTDAEKIRQAVVDARRTTWSDIEIFGKGDAGPRIADILWKLARAD